MERGARRRGALRRDSSRYAWPVGFTGWNDGTSSEMGWVSGVVEPGMSWKPWTIAGLHPT